MTKAQKTTLAVLALALIIGLWAQASADTVVKSIDLNCDMKALSLNTAWLEGEVDRRFIQTCGSISTPGCSMDIGNSGLMYFQPTYEQWYGIGDGSTRVQDVREYGLMYGIKLANGYDWYPGLKTQPRKDISIHECPDFYVYFNGKLRHDVYYNYNDSSGMLRIIVPIGYASVQRIVTSMSIDGGDFSMARGASHTFKVSMEGTVTSKAVTWSVTGNKSSKTRITTAGKLTIGSDETAAKLTVKAVSVQDKTASAKVTVTVSKKTPTITSVTVAPGTGTGYSDSKMRFTATVKGTQTDKSVTWTVSGAKSAGTHIASDGTLFIARNEPAGTIRVRATANRDTKKYAEAVVTVKKAATLSKLALTFNIEKIALSPAYTEGEVSARIPGNTNLKTTGCSLLSLISHLADDQTGHVSLIPNGKDKVDRNKKYFFVVSLSPKSGYTWPDALYSLPPAADTLLSAVDGLDVSVNGKTLSKSKVHIWFYAQSNTMMVFVPAQFSIDIADAAVTGIKASTPYTGKLIKPVPTVKAYGKKLTAGKDYKVTYSNNKNAGKATVKITGLGDFHGVITKHFKITRVPLKTVKVVNPSLPYTGKKHTPILVVKAAPGGKTKTLSKATDYTVSYTNNLNAGTAKVTVNGKGNYTGTLTTTFKINRLKLSTATAVLSQTTMKYTGKALKPGVTVKIKVDGKTVTLVKGTDFTVTYANNVKVGTATVTVKGKGNYTGTITLTFKIKK